LQPGAIANASHRAELHDAVPNAPATTYRGHPLCVSATSMNLACLGAFKIAL
jgi:hypothetical protein